MKASLKKGGLIGGYVLFFIVATAFFASIVFPYQRVRDRIVAAYNTDQAKSGGGNRLSIGEMSASWFPGVSFHDLTLAMPSSDPMRPPTELKVESGRVRLGIMSLLVGTKRINFSLNAFGGNISGSTVLGSSQSLSVDLSDIEFSQVGLITEAIGVPTEGKLNGEISFTVPDGKAAKASGSISLEATDLAIGDGKAKIKGALALPRIDVGSLTITAEAKDGVLKFSKIAAGGKDLELQGDGKVQLRDNLGESTVDLNVKFKINDAYRGKSQATKDLFGTPGSNAPALIEIGDARIKQSKRADGFYALRVRGPLSRIDFSPAAGAGSSSLAR